MIHPEYRYLVINNGEVIHKGNDKEKALFYANQSENNFFVDRTPLENTKDTTAETYDLMRKLKMQKLRIDTSGKYK